MLKLNGFDSKIIITNQDGVYDIRFEVCNQGDIEDTISYFVVKNECILSLSEIFDDKTIYQMDTDDRNIELLVGINKLGSFEIFFSLVDYEIDTKRDSIIVYNFKINKDMPNYKVLEEVIKVIEEDITYSKEGEDCEYKFDHAKH